MASGTPGSELPPKRLLITTQAVDLDDPILAFFHRWIEEFSKHFAVVHVICLKEGRHELPENVVVHSLGKEEKPSRARYMIRFYRYIWNVRQEYDAVFVHMNPEYVVLGGLFWRTLRKRVGLWFIHPKVSWQLRLAVPLVHDVFSASKESFPLRTTKLRPVGIGIDTDLFAPLDRQRTSSERLRVMTAARIAPVKRFECIIDAATELEKRGVPASFDLYGEELPRDRAYADEMRARAQATSSVRFCGTVLPIGMRDAYRTHDVHVNATTSGSFDKAVVESMACGCITVASNTAFAGVLPASLMFRQGDPFSLADALEHIQRMSEEDKDFLRKELRDTAVSRYSLAVLIQCICRKLIGNHDI